MARGILEIDGRRIELTDEQVEQLLSNEKSNEHIFSRYGDYYTITPEGTIKHDFESPEGGCKISAMRYKVANYCKDKELMQQRALHEILDRLLWRFSMENDGDKIDWNNRDIRKYHIFYEKSNNKFTVDFTYWVKHNRTYFINKHIAERAIKEIIEPFMKEHPEFVW